MSNPALIDFPVLLIVMSIKTYKEREAGELI